GLARSRPMLLLLRPSCSTMKFRPDAPGISPPVMSPRIGSPKRGCSTLITSAPQSPSTVPAEGTKPHSATSSTRMPSSTPVVARDVGERLLHDAIDRGLDRRGQSLGDSLAGERRRDAVALLEVLQAGLQRRHETVVVEHGGAEELRELAQLGDGPGNQPACVGGARSQLAERGWELLLDRLEVGGDPRQRLTDAFVQVARQPVALLSQDGPEPHRQLAELRLP